MVELLDSAHQADVALLDQVQEWHARGGTVGTRDRHHEPQVALDELLLGAHVPRVLAAGQGGLFTGSQQTPVANLAHVREEQINFGSLVEGIVNGNIGDGSVKDCFWIDDTECARRALGCGGCCHGLIRIPGSWPIRYRNRRILPDF